MAIDLEKYRKQPSATSTPTSLDKYRKQPVAPAQPEPAKNGFFKSLFKDVASTLVVKPVARATELATRTLAPNSLAAQGYREGGNMNVLGINVEEQKAFGQGGVKQIVGDAAKSASYLYGGGAVGSVGKATLAGRIGQGFVQGAKGGLISGSLYGGGNAIQRENATVGSVAKEAAIGGGIGLLSGGVLGGALPVIPALVKAAKPEKIMQRVARVNALDQEKFARTAKESIGEYLVKRGIYGNDDQIVNQLAKRFTDSKNVADDALSKLQGSWKNGAVSDALSDLAEREARVSSKNVPSQSFARVSELVQKHETRGLTMSEINEVKRLYERNVRLGYLKERNTDMVARSTNIDDKIRTWQFSQANNLGLKNLGEINKETQLARQLGDALLKKNARSGGNNAFGLTDAILISGGDPQAISMLLAKKTIGSKTVQSAVAKTLAPKATVGTPEAVFGKRAANQDIFPSTVVPSGESSFGTLNLGGQVSKKTGGKVTIPVTEAKPTRGYSKPKTQPLPPKAVSESYIPKTIPQKVDKPKGVTVDKIAGNNKDSVTFSVSAPKKGITGMIDAAKANLKDPKKRQGGYVANPLGKAGAKSESVSSTKNNTLAPKKLSDDDILAELNKYDTTPLTVKKPANTTFKGDTDAEFRIGQLQDKLQKGALSDAEIREAKSLLQSRGAIEAPAKKTAPTTSKKDKYAPLRSKLMDGEMLVKDKKGNIGAIDTDDFDATIYEKV